MKNASVFRRLLAYLGPYRGKLALALLCVILVSAGTLVFPWLIKTLFNSALSPSSSNPQVHLTHGYFKWLISPKFSGIQNINSLEQAVLGLMIVFFFTAFFQFLQTNLLVSIGQHVVTDIRVALYKHLQKLSATFYTKHHTGDIISRMTNDTAAVQGVLTSNVIELVRQPVMALGGILFLLKINSILTLIAISASPFILLVIRLFGRKIRHASDRVQEHLGGLTTLMNESFTGMTVMRSFGLADFFASRFEKENRQIIGDTQKVAGWRGGSDALVAFLTSAAISAVLGFGGYQMLTGRMRPGDLVAFLLYLQLVIAPVVSIAGIYSGFQQSLSSARRLFEILDKKPDIVSLPDAVTLPAIKGSVKFEKVSFGYNSDERILHKIDLDVKSGNILALVGPSGGGKSSLVSLISRFYDPDEGRILIDGFDIRKVDLNSLRSQIGIVPQDTFLFGVSVKENIRYGKLNATDEEIVEAARAANADKFIHSLPDGYETEVAERGVRLSGGERQRIAIARALLKDPRILILDEATSSLDTESEMLVQEALARLMHGRTCFVIAHRLSTIRNADAIAVIDHGRLVEYGSHEILLKQNGLYAHLYELQFKWQQIEAENIY